MENILLKVKKREAGTKLAKIARRNGLVPGVYYTKGEPATPIMSDPLNLRPIIYTSETHIVNLEIEGETGSHECVLREVTFDPVTEKIVHFDLIGLTQSIMAFEVPLVIKGSSVGVRDGGILQTSLHKLPVKCLPQFLPAHIEVDISNLQLGKSIYIKDLKIDNVVFDLGGDTPVVSCTHSRTSKAAEGQEA